MIRLINILLVIIGGSTKISITLGGSTWIVAVRGEGICNLRDRWIRSTLSNLIREKYFPNALSKLNWVRDDSEQAEYSGSPMDRICESQYCLIYRSKKQRHV